MITPPASGRPAYPRWVPTTRQRRFFGRNSSFFSSLSPRRFTFFTAPIGVDRPVMSFPDFVGNRIFFFPSLLSKLPRCEGVPPCDSRRPSHIGDPAITWACDTCPPAKVCYVFIYDSFHLSVRIYAVIPPSDVLSSHTYAHPLVFFFLNLSLSFIFSF